MPLASFFVLNIEKRIACNMLPTILWTEHTSL